MTTNIEQGLTKVFKLFLYFVGLLVKKNKHKNMI